RGLPLPARSSRRRARPPLVPALLSEIATARLPPRRDRRSPRAVKRKMSNFPLKRPEHATPPRPRPIADAIRVLAAVERTAVGLGGVGPTTARAAEGRDHPSVRGRVGRRGPVALGRSRRGLQTCQG